MRGSSVRRVNRQLGETAQVLGDGGKCELELRAGRSAKPQPSHPKYPLQVRKQHLDLLAIAPRLLIGGGLSDGTGDIARCLIHVACDLPAGRLGAALRLERANAAVGNAGKVGDGVVTTWSA